MQKTINWGIIGLGKIANKFAQDLQLVPGANLVAVASRSGTKAKEFGMRYSVPLVFDDYEKLTLSDQVDIVYIATPHTFHVEQSLMCFKHGKAVLCEKPLGLDIHQVESIIASAKKYGVFIMEGLWTRFIPATRKVIDILNSEVLGQITAVRADFGFKGDLKPDGRLYNKGLGGGSLLDVGIYPIYLSLLALGEPVEIKAMARMTQSGVDSYCAMLFSYDNDAKANLECGFESDTPIEGYIFGERGFIKMHRRFHHAESVTLKLYDNAEEVFHLTYKGNGYVHEIEHVHNCLTDHLLESPWHGHDDSLSLMRTMERVKNEIGLHY